MNEYHSSIPEDARKIVDFVVECRKYSGIDKIEVVYDDDLSKSIGLTSLDHIELTMELEKKYEIEITDEKIDELNSVKAFRDYIKELSISV